MRRIAGATLLVACCVVARSSAAQSVRTEPIRFGQLSVDHGLSQSIVRDALQDHTGFMWFATHDGLNRFDGYRIVTYRHEPDRPGSLPTSYLTALAERVTDEGAMLWIGSSQGVTAFDPAHERFTAYHHDPAQADTLPDDSVADLLVDAHGTLWVATARGLAHFDPARNRFIRYVDASPGGPSLSRDAVNALAGTPDGGLWVGTARGLVRLDASGRVLARWAHRAGDAATLGDGFVRAVLPDRRGRVWIGTDRAGVDRLDLATGRLDHFPRIGDARGVSINALLEDAFGEIWVGVWGGGLNLVVEDGDRRTRFISYRHDRADPASLAIDDVNVLAQDRSGVVWVGTYGAGLSWFTPDARTRFAHYRQTSAVTDLRDNRVFALQVDRSGTLWVGTWLGLDRFVAQGSGLGNYVRRADRDVPLTDRRVTAIAEAADGAIWVGTLDGGVNRVDPVTLRTRSWRRAEGLASDRILAITVSRSGAVWAGTLDAGISVIDPATGRVSTVPGDPGATPGDSRVETLFEDHRGAMWIGTYDDLDVVLPGATRPRAVAATGPAAALLRTQITALAEGPAGTLWVGTGGNGLLQLDTTADGRAVVTRAFRQADGMPNDRVSALLVDDRGHVWASTDDGIARIDPASGTVREFNVSDGLQAKEFRAGAFFDATTGRMFLGGTNGFNVFRPASLDIVGPPPTVALTDFSILNRPVPIGGSSPLATRITDTTRVTLTPADSVFSIEFAAFEFAAPERVRYSYQLGGFDREWNVTDASRRFATYTNLSPGTYQFRARAQGRDGTWGPPAQLEIVILPPYWMTWWFRGLASITAVALVLAIHRHRLRTLEEQRRVLQREVVARTRELEAEKERAIAARAMAEQANMAKSTFLASVSHELRTPLNAVVGLSDVIAEKTTDPKQREYFAALRSSGQALSELINDILDLSKIEAGRFDLTPGEIDVRQVLREATDLVRLDAERKGLRLLSSVSPRVAARVVGDGRALRRALFNLLANAVKFTPAGSVSVDVTPHGDGDLLFVVADTGIGIAEADQERIFGAFTQADASIARDYGGTGLGLTLTEQLVSLMRGRIWVESVPGSGSTFAFTAHLPPASTAAAAASAEGAPAPDIGALHILAVDDAPQNRLVLAAYFEGSGCDVHMAESGPAALAMFRERRYDLVLMDVSMPGMDGYAATQAMREIERDQQRPHTPILALTANAFAADVDRSRAAGCDGHLTKPIRKAVLFDAIRRYARPTTEAVDAPRLVTANATPLVRAPREVMRYVPEYLAVSRRQMTDALAALDAGDREPLRALGHNLKGSGGSFGLHDVSQLGAKLEDQARHATDQQLRETALALSAYLAAVQVVSDEN